MASLTDDDIAALKLLADQVRAARAAEAPSERAKVRGRDVFAPSAAQSPVGEGQDVVMKPGLGQIVVYRARTREYVLPAIVTANVETLDRRGVIRGHVPDITGEDHVHLNVQTCGEQLAYQEHDVPYSRDPIPGTWAWR